MFLLDTNVISELRKSKSSKANTNVVCWSQAQVPSSLFISAITILELEMGILLLERKDEKQGLVIRSWFDNSVLPAFENRILSIDTKVAQQCAKLHVPDPHSERDALIAATALVHKMKVVTRNVTDFKSTGVELVNPWELDTNK